MESVDARAAARAVVRASEAQPEHKGQEPGAVPENATRRSDLTDARVHHVGYVRVSTLDQNPASQLTGLVLDRVFTDHASGKDRNRPALREMLLYARPGDVLEVESIDRLARNLDDLRQLVAELTRRGVKVHFRRENLTFSAERDHIAELMLGIMGALAEFERALIRERQREGITLAQRQGKYTGGTRKLSPAAVTDLRARVAKGDESKAAIAREFRIHVTTLHRYLTRASA
jgi:DNA invertase Pin-like site-specific DNA recombinase